MPDPQDEIPNDQQAAATASSPSPETIWWLLVGAGAMLLVGVLILIVASNFYRGDSALWFIGFVLISLAALAMTAAVFRGLGYVPSPGEAFGLPSGSIRAVLAIAIMILLLIFGLPLVSSDKAPLVLNRAAVRELKVSCAAVDAEVKRYETRGLFVLVNSKDCPNATDARPLANLSIFAQYRAEMGSQQLEVSKQLLTAVITLLTTIIGFYFGSQNAISLVNAIGKNSDSKPKPGQSDPGGKGQGGAGAKESEEKAGDPLKNEEKETIKKEESEEKGL